MFAAFDWHEVLMKAQIGGVVGGVGGVGVGLVAYLMRKLDDRKRSEAEAPELTRPHAKAGTAKPTLPLPLLLILVAIVAAGPVLVNPALVAPLLPFGRDIHQPGAAGGNRQPSATISDYGRYHENGPIRVVPDRNTSGGVSVVSDHEYVLLENTDRIPCRAGETWGIRIRASDVPINRPYTVRKEMHHPPIEQPDGSVRTKSVAEFKLRPGTPPDHFCGRYFPKGYEYELMAGEWTVAVFIDDAEAARKVFKIQK